MYAESGLMFPYFHTFSPDVQQFDDFYHPQKSNACLDSLVQTSTVSDYDLGAEGDLFKAPEPIISCGEDAISQQELRAVDIESLQSEEFLNDVFYECKDILAKEAQTETETETETSPLSEALNYKFPSPVVKESVHPPGEIPKSASSDSLSSMEWIHGAQIKPSFINVTEVGLGNVYGMRRAFSEGDIKSLANGCRGVTGEHTTEDRWQKLSRYRDKKTKRNFGRKIKYACRKALADSQPRIRGRFAKTE